MSSRTFVERLTQLPHDSLLGALVRVPLKLIPRDRVVRVRSGINRGAAWVTGASVHGCWLGTYEAGKQHLMEGLVRPGMTVWDVGANAGFYTLACARLVGSGGRVYAFEPLAENAANLLTHLRLNDVRNAVLVQAAVGSADGMVGFRVAASNSMGQVSADADAYLVPCVTLDSFLRDHPGAKPDLLKVDIEGGESALLEGGAQFFRDQDAVLVLSLHGADQQQRCRKLLQSFGYSMFRLDGSVLENDALSDEIVARKIAAGSA